MEKSLVTLKGQYEAAQIFRVTRNLRGQRVEYNCAVGFLVSAEILIYTGQIWR